VCTITKYYHQNVVVKAVTSSTDSKIALSEQRVKQRLLLWSWTSK